MRTDLECKEEPRFDNWNSEGRVHTYVVGTGRVALILSLTRAAGQRKMESRILIVYDDTKRGGRLAFLPFPLLMTT